MRCKMALNGMISIVEGSSEYLIMYMGIMIALNGDTKRYSKLQSLQLFLISHYLIPVLFAALQMSLGFGIRNTLNIYLNYPDLIRVQATNGKVFASTDHKYNCYHFASFQMNPELHVGCTFSYKPGTNFSHRHYLSMVNYFLNALKKSDENVKAWKNSLPVFYNNPNQSNNCFDNQGCNNVFEILIQN